MKARTRSEARLARAYVRNAWPTSPNAVREHVGMRREHADAYAAMAVSDEERRFAAALRFAADEASAALAELEAVAA